MWKLPLIGGQESSVISCFVDWQLCGNLPSHQRMGTQRMEAFSDGVIAVIITITVFDIKPPVDPSWHALISMTPYFLSYALSFVVVAIMWVNHHHLAHLARHASAKMLWANNMLLFWMSLIPFTTAYMGQRHWSPLSVALYGTVLTLCALAFTLLRWIVNQEHLNDPAIREHNERVSRKNMLTTFLYAASVPLAYASITCSIAIFVLIPAAYFLPERGDAELRPEHDKD